MQVETLKNTIEALADAILPMLADGAPRVIASAAIRAVGSDAALHVAKQWTAGDLVRVAASVLRERNSAHYATLETLLAAPARLRAAEARLAEVLLAVRSLANPHRAAASVLRLVKGGAA